MSKTTIKKAKRRRGTSSSKKLLVEGNAQPHTDITCHHNYKREYNFHFFGKGLIETPFLLCEKCGARRTTHVY